MLPSSCTCTLKSIVGGGRLERLRIVESANSVCRALSIVTATFPNVGGGEGRQTQLSLLLSRISPPKWPKLTTTRPRRSCGKLNVSYGATPPRLAPVLTNLRLAFLQIAENSHSYKIVWYGTDPDTGTKWEPTWVSLPFVPSTFTRYSLVDNFQRKQEKKSYANSALADSWKAEQAKIKAAKKATKLAKAAELARRKVRYFLLLLPTTRQRHNTYSFTPPRRHCAPLHYRNPKIQQPKRTQSPTNPTGKLPPPLHDRASPTPARRKPSPPLSSTLAMKKSSRLDQKFEK